MVSRVGPASAVRDTHLRPGQPMIAIVSDLHANMEAIRAVLDDIERRGIDRILCLGDVIGYGPEPVEALRLVERFEVCLRGNHEEAVLTFAEDFNEKARTALDWTRDRLNDESLDREERFRLWGILGDRMIVSHRIDDALLVHGSPRDPIREYMLPRDANDRRKMAECFARMESTWCFVGHSHVPGVYPEDGGFLAAADLDGGFRAQRGRKAIVNVGSVGQPRDGDPRACYAVWDGDEVRFLRVAYDVEATRRKILETGVLPRYLADRLALGR